MTFGLSVAANSKTGLSHDQIEKSGCMAVFLSEKRKKLGSGRVFLNYDVL